jgi:outer membrane lipoprotein-sorting protein
MSIRFPPVRVPVHAVFLAALAAAASGCGATLGPTHPITDVARVLERREASTSALHAIRAEARVDQRKGSGRIRGTVLMFIEQSGRVRFDVMTQFGPVAILTSDGAHFAYADFREKRFLTGETCPQNIARLLGVPLTAEETAHFLLGGTPVIAHQGGKLELGKEGHYHLQLPAAEKAKQELELAVYPSDRELPPERQRLYLVRSELWNAAGASVWRVRYEDYEPLDVSGTQVLVPRRVQIEQGIVQADTLVRFKTMKPNPEIPDNVFVQEARPGLTEEAASCE